VTFIDSHLPLGRRLKVIRVARGLRQRDVALTAGLPPSILSLIEGDYRPPRDSELAAILLALGIDRDDLGDPGT
jgi:transcriptional regulator with XRE-family HTH domain